MQLDSASENKFFFLYRNQDSQRLQLDRLSKDYKQVLMFFFFFFTGIMIINVCNVIVFRKIRNVFDITTVVNMNNSY